MFVCICHGITDNTINDLIDEGSTTMRCLSRGLNVGTECGQCVKSVKQVLNNKLVEITNAAGMAGRLKQLTISAWSRAFMGCIKGFT